MTKKSSGTVVTELKKRIDDIGPARVAADIGEWDTQNILRWVREKWIPITKVKMVEHYLKGDLS